MKKTLLNSTCLCVPRESEGERLDLFLSKNLPDISRNRLQKLIKDGDITIGGKGVKASRKLVFGEEILINEVPVVEPDILPINIPIEILYEDDDLLVVNKPKGMSVHPANGHFDDTLVNALMFSHKDSLSGINGVLRPGIVHRIDMDTTGSLIVCKNDEAHNFIAEQLKEHSTSRIYVGIVHGVVKEDGVIDAPIGRSLKDRKKMAVIDKNSKRAITHYRVLERFDKFTFMEFKLETGRTHQIRVHMAHLGHPLLGDEVYGPAKCPFKLQGQTLHAKTIGFVQPTTKEYIEVEAPLPEYFSRLLAGFRNRV